MDVGWTHSVPDAALIRRLLANFPNGTISVLDRDYRYQFVQGRGIAADGLDADLLVGRLLSDVFSTAQFTLAQPFFRRAFAGEAVTFDLPFGSRAYSIFAEPFDHDGDSVDTIIAVSSDVTAARAAEARTRLLVEATDVLVASLDIEQTLAAVAQLVVPRLADWCVIHLVGDDGEIERVAVTHADPTKETLARELVEGYAFKRDAATGTARVLRTGKSELLPRIHDEMLVAAAVDERQLALLRSVGLISSVIVPMLSHGHVVGAITLAATEPREPYDADALALAEALARRATLAFNSARLYRLAHEELARRDREAEGGRLRQAALSRLATSAVIGIGTAKGDLVVEANDVFLRMVGYDTQDLAEGRLNWRMMTPPEYRSLDDQALEELAATGSSTPFEKEYVRKDGSRVPVLIGAARLEGEPLHWVCYIVDLSARRALEDAQQASIAEAEHDLLNPVTVVRWQAQLLRRRLRSAALDTESFDQGLEVIEGATAHMQAMIEDLMDVVRVRLGQPVELTLAPTELVELTARSVESYRLSSDRHTFAVRTTEPALMGTWDGAKLDRVLNNLLANAVKYSPGGRTVTVSLSRERTRRGDWALLAVQDEGVGIPDADIPTVFERFKRGRNVAGETTGSGIGLAVVKQIVEQHGGTVWVESVEGQGSTFTVRLPLAEP